MESARIRAEKHLSRLVADKYLLKRVLGVGGHGAVYEATHRWTGRRVAVKLLLDAGAGPLAAERFLREARASTRVAHPNIVEVLDMGRDEALDGMYLVEEFLDGEDLRMRLRREERLTPRDAVDVMLPVMRALAAAHSAGVVHRDVKPANIFLALGADGGITPKLIDFGVSRVYAADGSGAPLTMTGTPIGTPDYMSPEQARGAKELDGRSDIWAVGVVLYELVAGVRPFRGGNFNALIFRVALEEPVSLGRRVPELPEGFVAAVHRALAKDPADRFIAMEDFVTALDAVRDELPAHRPAVVNVPEHATEDTPVPPHDTLAGADPAAPAPMPVFAAPRELAPSSFVEAMAEGRRTAAVLDDVSPQEVDRAAARARLRERAVAGLAIVGLAVGAAALSTRAAPAPNPTREAPSARPLAPAAPDASVAAIAPAPQVERPLAERLSASQVRAVADAARPAVRRCMGATFFGQVVAVFTVRPDGGVARVAAQGAVAASARGRCVSEALGALRFPAFASRSPMEVSWRYVFAPGDSRDD